MKISIITVCYNSEAFIASAIESVLSQSYTNIEYIVIDGGSQDGTMSIIQSYGERIARVVSEPDEGIYDAMNKGITLATGEVIGILNSDDFYPHADVVAQVVEAFAANPDTQMVLGNVDFVRPDDLTSPVRFYSSFRFYPWKMRFGFMPAHPATFIKRTTFQMSGDYKLGYKTGADFDWFVRALVVNRLPYTMLNLALVRMREGGVSTSGLKSYWLTSKEELRALRENGVYSNFLFVLLRLPIKFVQKIFRKTF